MKLNEVHEMWKKDCVIDQLDLTECSRNTPVLHAKYLELLTHERMRLKKLEQTQAILMKAKWLYYSGKMDKCEMDRRGWPYDPFDGLKVLKGDIARYYEADEDLQKQDALIEYVKIVIDTLTQIVDTLKWRHQTIKNCIEWNKFTSGA